LVLFEQRRTLSGSTCCFCDLSAVTQVFKACLFILTYLHWPLNTTRPVSSPQYRI